VLLGDERGFRLIFVNGWRRLLFLWSLVLQRHRGAWPNDERSKYGNENDCAKDDGSPGIHSAPWVLERPAYLPTGRWTSAVESSARISGNASAHVVPFPFASRAGRNCRLSWAGHRRAPSKPQVPAPLILDRQRAQLSQEGPHQQLAIGTNSRTSQGHLDLTACSGIGFPKPGAARVPAFQNFEHRFTHTSDGFALLAKIPTEPGRPPSCRSWSSPPRVSRNPTADSAAGCASQEPSTNGMRRRTGGAPSCLFRRIRSLAAVSFRDQTLRDKWPRSRFHEQENDSRLAEG